MSSLWGNMTQEEGQALANLLAQYRPFVGRRVRVIGNGVHQGRVGIVTWHGVDTFRGRQYGDSFTRAAREVQGRYGYRVRVKPDDDGAQFFVSADAVMVCVDDHQRLQGETA